jgi:L-seryl-tRNA(Ser) seleniumtransferase
VEALRARATALCALLTRSGLTAHVVASEGSVGGGAYPAARLPSAAVALTGDANDFEARLRAASLPVVGRIADGELLLDLRSVPAADDQRLATAVTSSIA